MNQLTIERGGSVGVTKRDKHLIEEPVIRSPLRELVGKRLDVGVTLVSSRIDPDEDVQGVSDLIGRPTDELDVVGAYVYTMDPIQFGLLTRRISPQELHKRDEDAVRRSIECKQQHRK